jgi:hypothetical protein
MASFIQAKEYVEEGITLMAVVEDTAGKYVVTKDSSDPIPLMDYHFSQRRPQMQSRSAMMT